MAEDILVELFDVDADPDEVDRLTRAVREELLDIDEVGTVRPAEAGPAPEGTRGLTLAALGALLVQAPATVEVVAKVLSVIRSFLSRGGSERTMRVTVNGQSIELTPTKEQQQALVDRFLAQAVPPAPGA
ncbi:MAG TPA: hypothetical protein PLP61_08355 [Nocardioides sp.]|uniref:effector-associated constant component EACC1 n=1 Tax=Nocardioides sp. TaxID=35761 RepID=UPI002CD20E8F|nr:hypothetical protein [Nocardioides sp.]HQR27033.1 hypothetical protein [Nocardioides sp.]